eukprot:UN06179
MAAVSDMEKLEEKLDSLQIRKSENKKTSEIYMDDEPPPLKTMKAKNKSVGTYIIVLFQAQNQKIPSELFFP